MVAEGGQSRCVTRTLESYKSKKENTGAPSPLCTNKKEIIMNMKKQQQIDGGERGWRESQFNEIHARCTVLRSLMHRRGMLLLKISNQPIRKNNRE